MSIQWSSLFISLTGSPLVVHACVYMFCNHAFIYRATPAKLQLMCSLLMTALSKVVDLPESREVNELKLHVHVT